MLAPPSVRPFVVSLLEHEVDQRNICLHRALGRMTLERGPAFRSYESGTSAGMFRSVAISDLRENRSVAIPRDTPRAGPQSATHCKPVS